MNIKRLTELRDFFLAGAPHVHFDMKYGFARVEDFDYISVPDDCGSVACIAGAANHLAGEKPHDELDWEDVRDNALELLGLPRTSRDSYMGHDLFDPDLAPRGCTAQQAAEAIQNVIDGKEPWDA